MAAIAPLAPARLWRHVCRVERAQEALGFVASTAPPGETLAATKARAMVAHDRVLTGRPRDRSPEARP